MQTFTAQLRKIGDQMVIIIPKEAIAAEQLSNNTFVKVTVQKIQQTARPKNEDTLGPEDPWKLLE
ncbi:MAG: hypothetical protein ACM3UY_04095 [Methanocella sp.]|jgi:antitoxin component of MazEF toxin-antitoxin module